MDLEPYADAWRDAPDSDTMDDGVYYCIVDSVILKAIKDGPKAGTPMLTWQLTVVGPKCIDRKIFKNSVFSPKSLKWIKIDLKKAGLDPVPDIGDLPDYLPDLSEKGIKVKLSTKEYKGRDIQNVNFQSGFDPEEYVPDNLDYDGPF